MPLPADGVLHLSADSTHKDKRGSKHPLGFVRRESDHAPYTFGFDMVLMIASWERFRFPVAIASIDPDIKGHQNKLFRHMLDTFEPPSWVKEIIVTGDAHAATPRFSPDVPGSYVLELQVFDGSDHDFDNVLITIEAPRFRNASTRVEVTVTNERSTLDRRTRQLTSTADVTIRNVSATPIAAPIHAVFVPSAANVDMLEASGVNSDGHPFYDLEQKTATDEPHPVPQ